MVHMIRIIAALFLCTVVHAKKPEMNFVIETSVIKSRSQFTIERRYIGTIKAEKFSLLSPKSPGTVASIDVKPGMRVKKGQLLIGLTGDVEQTSLELAEQSVKYAQEKVLRSRKLFASEDITKSQLADAEQELINAKSKLAAQRQAKEKVELRSPFDGVVGVPRVVLGESVQPQTSVISVMDGPFSVFINIPAARLAEVKIGQTVKIKAITSTIAAVEQSIDPVTRTGFAKVMLPNCDTCIIGDSVYVAISVYDKPNAILITKNAVFYRNQKPHVVVVVKGEGEKRYAEIREITVGEEQEGEIEVTAGLKDGEEIVNANPKRIPDKANVSVLQ